MGHSLEETVEAVLPAHNGSIAQPEEVGRTRKWLARIGLALFIADVLSVAVFSVRDFSWKDSAYVSRAANAAQEYRSYTDREITRCYQGPLAQAQKCADDARNAYEHEYREEYNLAAQQSSAWWTKVAGIAAIFAGALIFMTFWQTLRQAREIEVTVRHAGRSATAMEGVASSMTRNATKIEESVALQKRLGTAQMRAYVTVQIGGGSYQDDNHVFEVDPVVVNKGFTTARKLRWRVAADVLPIPVPKDFKFPLPKEALGGTDLDGQMDGMITAVIRDRRRLSDEEAQTAKVGNGAALTVWGYLWYDDIFGKRHRRTFSQQIWWTPTGDRRLDGSYPLGIKGVHLRHNRGS